jgi:hypothetical protein
MLVEGGGCIDDIRRGDLTSWGMLHAGIGQRRDRGIEETDAAEFSLLLKLMVMIGDAPQYFITVLTPLHAEICARVRKLRAQLPSYLKQQRASVVSHCPMPTVLQNIVAGYAATTVADMWTDGLRV